MPQTILEMAKDLIMAHIQSGTLTPEDMQKELQKTYASLMELKSLEEAAAAGTDAVARAIEGGSVSVLGKSEQSQWKRSIKKYTIECLECGTSFKQLSIRHLKEHGLDARSYRAKYGIPRTQPLSAKDTTATRKKIVQQNRPWEKAPTYLKAQARKAASESATKTGATKTSRTRKKPTTKA